jgi:zinc/manganese transport system substrate-binding protein
MITSFVTTYSRRLLAVTAVLAATFVLVSTGAALRQRQASERRAADGQLLVVASTFPTYDFARTIAAGVPTTAVVPLLPPGVGPHDFSPTPETAQRFARADIVVKNGLGFDTFVDKLIAASGNSTLTVVDVNLGVPTLPATAAASDDEDAGGADPHTWLNPRHAAQQVQHIRDALIAADPANRATYEQNAGRYVTALNSLDANLERVTAAAPRKELVTFHSAFRYLAARYGLDELAVFQLDAGVEPTPQELAATIAAIKERRVTTIFVEPQFSPKLVETVARDLKLTVETLDPLETGAETDSYLALMNRNLEALRRGLR